MTDPFYQFFGGQGSPGMLGSDPSGQGQNGAPYFGPNSFFGPSNNYLSQLFGGSGNPWFSNGAGIFGLFGAGQAPSWSGFNGTVPLAPPTTGNTNTPATGDTTQSGSLGNTATQNSTNPLGGLLGSAPVPFGGNQSNTFGQSGGNANTNTNTNPNINTNGTVTDPSQNQNYMTPFGFGGIFPGLGQQNQSQQSNQAFGQGGTLGLGSNVFGGGQ